jgi:cation:H+ antiporter
MKLFAGIANHLIKVASVTKAGAASAVSALWTFPTVILSAFVIAWAAEAAQFFISQGMALAILAWLQTLPEFAVEAVIAWEAGKDPAKLHLMIANLTGSLRLLVGLGWPMIFFTAAAFQWKQTRKFLGDIELEGEHSVEVLGLGVPLLYWIFIWYKGTLTLLDALILTLFYGLYLFILNKIPPQEEEKIEEMDYIPRMILHRKAWLRNLLIIGLFVAGGLILYFTAEPFLHSMLALAVSIGVSEFVFVQWVAPFLTEFPEKLSAFNWARRISAAPMALMNMVSSNINQWTMLAAMLPIALSISRGFLTTIVFDGHQKMEILLTISQSLLGLLLLANMRFSWYEALGIFILWFTQFILPDTRREITAIYFAWCLIEIVATVGWRKHVAAMRSFRKLIKTHW